MAQFESEFEERLYRQRHEKLKEIADIGRRLGLGQAESLYPNRFPASGEAVQLSPIPHILARYDTPADPVSAEQLEAERPEVAVAGRLMSHRLQGKAGFAHLQGGGKRLQIYIRRDDVGDDLFALYKLLDLGDHIGVRGLLMRTRTGELTLKALTRPGPEGKPLPAISFLAKAMLALPDKYHGLEDVELRYRQRYVDLIMNSGTLAKSDPVTIAENTAAAHKPGAPSSPAAVSAAKVGENTAAAHTSGAPSSPAVLSPAKVGEGATLPPGTSLVTDTAAPNKQHRDAPNNVREVFEKRAKILRALRRFFDDRGYLEVETPMMQPVAGGATARPFTTHHNALDLDLYLRIAPELYLKRLVVGGLDRVYEINRNFRNEGIDTQHNPEFTMLEFYQAYSNYHDLMDLTQELIKFVALEVNGTTKTHFNGTEIDLSQWQRLSMREATTNSWPEEDWGRKPAHSDFCDSSKWMAILNEAKDKLDSKLALLNFYPSVNLESPLATIYHPREMRWKLDRDLLWRQLQSMRAGGELGKSISEVFEWVSEPHLIQPTIIYDFPLAVSPLSKPKPNDPDWVERFEFYIGGFEVGNAFSELNDPEDQRRRFLTQLEQKAAGDEEAMAEMDEDYVRALAVGLPPTAGEGIGIDRLTMLLTGSRSIRDVILFPLLRPKSNTPDPSTPQPPTEQHTHGESAE